LPEVSPQSFGAFAVAAVGGQAEVVHRHEDPPLHRIQPVPDIRKRARDDHAHRVIEIRLPHFCFDIDRKQYRCICLVRHFPSLLLNLYRCAAYSSMYAFTVVEGIG